MSISPKIHGGESEEVLDKILAINGDYVMPFLMVFGCINNIFVLIVMSLPHYKKHVSCFYLRILAAFDTVNLLGVGINLTTGVMFILIEELGTPFCAVMTFIAYFGPPMSSWLLVAITMTRFIAVVFPMKARNWTNMKFARIYFGMLVLVFFAWAFPGLLYGRSPFHYETQGLICVFDVPQNVFAGYNIGDTTLSLMLPFILLVVFNSLIFFRLNKRKGELSKMKVQADQKDDRVVKLMVMVVTVAYVILIFPYVVQVAVWEVISGRIGLNPYQIKQRIFSYNISAVLYAVNCSINFFLYFISCRKFRLDFLFILACKPCKMSNS